MKRVTLGVAAAGVFALARVTLGRLSRVSPDQDQPDVSGFRPEVGQRVVARFGERTVEGVFDGYVEDDLAHFRIRLPDGNGLILPRDDLRRLRPA